jgi:hypothetical protein
MIEPISAGGAMTGLRMIWAGLTWLIRSRQAPWSAVPISATIRPHILPWYEVTFRGANPKPFVVELLSVRTIRPVGLPLRRCSDERGPVMVPHSEARLIENLGWGLERAGGQQYQKTFFVNLDGLHGEKAVDFELKARFIDNRRTECPIWVRSNVLTLP